MDTLARKQNQMVSASDKAHSQIEELTQAADDFQSNRFVMGSHHLSLTVFADTIPALRKVVAQARSDLAESGAVVAREDLGLEGAYWAQLPGNERRRPRPGVTTSANWADMNSLHGYPAGAATGYWGPPAARFRTAAATPYDFHFHVGDLGNIFMCGPSGSGKTTLLLFLLAMAERFNPTTVFFDYGRGGEIFSRAVGGSYLVAPSGEDTGWAPLRGLSNSPEDVTFLCGWIAGLITKSGYQPTPDDERRIHRGVTSLLKLEPSERSLSELRAFLGQREMAGAGARIDKWCAGKSLGWAFDGPEDQTDLSHPFVGYDMTAVLDDPEVRGPAMAYMFHRVEALLDGRRIVVAIDEFWKALADPAFSAMVNEKLKTIRKRNGVVILATQSPRDALNSPISHSILEQCPTQIFMPNSKANREDYVDGMKLTEREFLLVKEEMTPGSRQFLLKQGTVSVTCGLDLSHAQDCIAVLSGRDNTVRLMEQIIKDAGNDPTAWLDTFMSKALEEAS